MMKPLEKSSGHWWQRRRIATLVASLIIAAAAIGVAVDGNNFRIRMVKIAIPTANGQLDAVLATPRNQPSRGVVIFIHGSGPVTATNQGFYLPWFEAAADESFASLSWSKAGIGDSTGNWHHQSMDDRAAEVSAALDWAKRQPQIATDTIVVWGGSQGGWVAPKVAATRDDIAAYVALSPAINWVRQALNRTVDATLDLIAMRKTNIPVLLLTATQDRYVDVAETEATYRHLLANTLTTYQFDGAHSSVRSAMEQNALLQLVTGFFQPRALMADGVLATFGHFLAELKPAA